MTIYVQGWAEVELVSAYVDDKEGYCFLKAKQLTPYGDGSGANLVGRIIHADDKIAKGWMTLLDFKATDGIKEILDKARALPQTKPDNFNDLLHYYWPHAYKKNGERKKKAA